MAHDKDIGMLLPHLLFLPPPPLPPIIVVVAVLLLEDEREFLCSFQTYLLPVLG